MILNRNVDHTLFIRLFHFSNYKHFYETVVTGSLFYLGEQFNVTIQFNNIANKPRLFIKTPKKV